MARKVCQEQVEFSIDTSHPKCGTHIIYIDIILRYADNIPAGMCVLWQHERQVILKNSLAMTTRNCFCISEAIKSQLNHSLNHLAPPDILP